MLKSEQKVLDPELQVKSWDRLPKESRKAFDAFVIYRNLPDNRRLQLVADQLHCSSANVRRWAARGNWRARARARDWDIYQDQRAQEATVRERRRMAERQAHYGAEMQEFAFREFNRIKDWTENGRPVRYKENGEWRVRREPFHLDANSIIKLIEMGTRLERMALGDPTENRPAKIEIILGVDDPPPDDPEFLKEAIAAQEAALGRRSFSPN